MGDYYERLEVQLTRLTERGAHRPSVAARLRSAARRPSGGGVALAFSLLVVVAVVVAFLGARTDHPTGSPTAQSGDIDPVLVANLKLLRRPLGPGDRIPVALKAGKSGFVVVPAAPPGQPVPSSFGLLPGLARHVALGASGVSVWLIPGRYGLCWDATDRTGTLAGGVCSGALKPAATLVDSGPVGIGSGFTVGLVTDLVASIEELTAAGAHRALPLRDGFFASDRGARVIATTVFGRKVRLPIVGGR